MNLFQQIQVNVDNVRNNIPNILGQVVDDNESRLSDLQVSQIEEGIASDGSRLGEYENPEYAEYKQSIGSKAPLGVYDFKLEGDFLSKTYIKHDESFGGIEFGSDDIKEQKLETLSEGSDRLWGFAPQNIDELEDIIINPFQILITNELTRT